MFGLHPRDETDMFTYKTIENEPPSLKQDQDRTRMQNTMFGLHPRDETDMFAYKTIENGSTSFA